MALVAWFRDHPEYESLRSAFLALLVRRLTTGTKDPTIVAGLHESLMLEEVEAMYKMNVEAWELKVGRKARQEGLRKGVAGLLLRAKIAAAAPEAIEMWSARLFDARSLDEVVQ